MTPGPELTDADVEELLGAYALDACEPDEIVAVEAVLLRRPDLAREAARLSRAATWIGATGALEPPSHLRGSVLGRARAQQRAQAGDPVVELYREQSRRFEEAVELVRDDALDDITTNGLSARDLVVHEAAQESLLAQAVGRTPVPDIAETDIEARTAALVDHFSGRPLDDALAMWRASVDENCAWAADSGGATASWRGLELDRDDAIIVRAFETWIHTDDLRRVVGLGGLPPEPRYLSLMSDLAGRTLSAALVLVDRARPARRRVSCSPARAAATGSSPWTAVGLVPVTPT